MIGGAIVLAALACGVSAVLVRWLASPASRLVIVDHPNERSLHVTPTPRTGGIAIFAGIALALVIQALLGRAWPAAVAALRIDLFEILGITAVVAIFSFWEDRVGLGAGTRFVLQTLAALVIVVFGPAWLDRLALSQTMVDLGWLAIPVSVSCLVWMTNLYNFMDGMDGFAGGMTAIGFGAFAVAVFAHGGDPALGTIAAIVSGAAAGFLSLNWPPARIFMGDVGSVPLGFLAAALALSAEQRGIVSIWASILMFSPFIVDATVTLGRRAWRRERVWQAHRSHFYQRLVLAGWTHRRTAAAECMLMIACAVSALAFSQLDGPARVTLLVTWAAVYAVLMWLVGRVERETRRNGLLHASASHR